MLVYADTGDVEKWSGVAAPDNAKVLIRRASQLVAVATRHAYYDTTPAGLPSDPDVADAMRDATCAHVQAMVDAGVANATVGSMDAAVTKTSLDGASIDYDVNTAESKRQAVLTTLCPEGMDILTIAGLIGGHPWVR